MASSSNQAGSQAVPKPALLQATSSIQYFQQTSESNNRPSPATVSSSEVEEDSRGPQDQDTSKGGERQQPEDAASLKYGVSLSGQAVQQQGTKTAANRGHSLHDSGIGGMFLCNDNFYSSNDEDGSNVGEHEAIGPMGNEIVEDNPTPDFQECRQIAEDDLGDLDKSKNTSEAVRGKDLSTDDQFQAFQDFLRDGYHAVKNAMETDVELQGRQAAATEAAAKAGTAITSIKEDMMSRLKAIEASASSNDQLSSAA
ncbi:hypothetical protein CABS01_11789 [Colletotrichum abscissum]|uniref:Uncharacterized protein n=1 Tax=Colletotrichum abscissum TaxID=1671311 RepID=A0A9P9XB92_9PEZI|nr:uncharacterized protein CABS01_11789 [Colletotrichum abscissum]KAI3545127.1 hypothetical protein CABS02_09470 [Colletotrichum abscissum]KAK1492892.1 hypothetical protein CABS01_11789 [Colletotrichum abscissum]